MTTRRLRKAVRACTDDLPADAVLPERQPQGHRYCPTKPHLDILSHHPVNLLAGPTRPAPHPDEVFVADFHKLKRW